MNYERLKQRVADLSAEQVRELADRMISDTTHRGFFVRLAAAETASRLRKIATMKELIRA